MEEEYAALKSNGTWDLVPRPPGANVMTGKWIFMHKFNADGTGMAAGRVVFGYDNTRPDIIPDPYTNIHTHQVNRVKKWTRTRTHRVSVGYRVSGGYATVKYKSACKLIHNTVIIDGS
jgi:hypothetical protein